MYDNACIQNEDRSVEYVCKHQEKFIHPYYWIILPYFMYKVKKLAGLRGRFVHMLAVTMPQFLKEIWL